MKPLFVPLKTRWFRAFAEGRKTREFRAYGPRWNERVCHIGRPVVLSHGYNGSRIRARVKSFAKMAINRAPVAAREIYAGHDYLAVIEMDFS